MRLHKKGKMGFKLKLSTPLWTVVGIVKLCKKNLSLFWYTNEVKKYKNQQT